eukprot:106840_1
MASLEEENQRLQEQLHTLQQQYDVLSQEHLELKQDRSNVSAKRKHAEDFWRTIDDKCKYDPDYIKTLITQKEITMFEMNKDNDTLLIVASRRGCYEIVQLCINLGADINHKNKIDQTALDSARGAGYYEIEQLLLFSKMNATIGNKIKNTANIINKQKGINVNIRTQLRSHTKEHQEIFRNTLFDIMRNIINNRLSFSDDLLNLCFDLLPANTSGSSGGLSVGLSQSLTKLSDVDCSNDQPILSSALWKSIKKVCKEIIETGNQRDWFWMKAFIIPSTIWFKKIGDDSYLYYELLKMVETESANELNNLETNLKRVQNGKQKEWNQLTTWDIPHDTIVLPEMMNRKNERNPTGGYTYSNVRQDNIPNGLQSRYKFSELLEHSTSRFNAYKFYDYNEYLPQLILLAQMVDNEFQKSVQNIFNINKYSLVGQIENDDANNRINNEMKYDIEDGSELTSGSIKYKRGPVKLIERTKSKTDNDYGQERYPTTACCLDLNRCSLIFNDITTLLNALRLFANKVKYYQSGCIIGIVRVKNGFTEYVKQTQYADIKLNVLIKGVSNNILGEVQFLLEDMMVFKHKAHNLYSIERQKEYIQNSVSLILPSLNDSDKKMFIAAKQGNVNSLCELMVLNTKTHKDILKINKENHQTILHTICLLGHQDAFLFLKSILSVNLFIHHLFLSNNRNQKPIEYALRNDDVFIAKYLFTLKVIKQKYIDDENEFFRLLYWLFCHGKNEKLIDYILDISLNISHEKIAEFVINYKYKPKSNQIFAKNDYKYHKYTIIARTVERNKTLNGLKKVVSIIGTKALIEAIFISDGWNMNGVEYAIKLNKMKTMQYLLSFAEIRNRYLSDKNQLFRLLYWLFARSSNEDMIDYVLSELKVSNQMIRKLLCHKYIDVNSMDYAPSHVHDGGRYYQYDKYRIIGQTIAENKIKILKKLISKVGVKSLIKDDHLETVIECNKLDVMQYVVSLEVLNPSNARLLVNIVLWINKYHQNELMLKYMVKEFKLNETNLRELQAQYDIITDDVIKTILIVNEKKINR